MQQLRGDGRSRTSTDTATTSTASSPSSTLARRRMRARTNQPAASTASRIAVFTSRVTPYDVFQSCERCSSSNDARTTPVTARTATPPAASNTARLRGASRTSTSPISAPIHAAAPSTCSTSATTFTPLSPGSSECPATDGTIASPSASTRAGRSARRSSVAAPASDATTTAATKPAPNAVPARVWSPTRCASSAAPRAATTAHDERVSAIVSSRTRATRANRAMPTAPSRPARKSQREATAPAPGRVDSAESTAVGGGRPRPTAKARTPDSRWPSSEMIDQRTEYAPLARPRRTGTTSVRPPST
jgi:hypothetical protein